MRRGTLIALLAVAAIAGCGPEAAPSTSTSPPTSIEAPAMTAPETTGATGAARGDGGVPVLAVLDGDSLAVEVDGGRVEVRLVGINTPERDECHGDRSREAMTALVGEVVRLVEVVDVDPTDQFGRLLRDVWSEGVWVNGALVEQGAAMAIHTGAATQAELMALDEEAWQAGVGMWARDACGEWPYPEGVGISRLVADPPGPDEEALDAEAVFIVNGSDRRVDLSGWVLRDESTRNRYVFPQGVVLDPGEEIAVSSGCDSPGFCSDTPIWNNGGDMALLLTPTGSVVDRYRYTRD